jgi:hypothetical protein
MTEPRTDRSESQRPESQRPESGRHDFDQHSDVIDNGRQPPRRSRVVAWTTIGAVGVTAAVGGVVAAHSAGSTIPTANTALGQAAAATSPSSSPSGSQDDKGGRRGPGGAGPSGWGRFAGPAGPGAGGLGRLPGGGDVLHGEATVKTPSAGTEIVDTQNGTISAVDTTAKTITITSTDKASFSYVVTSTTRLVDFAAASPMKATLADLLVGDTVRIVATRSGDVRTATSLLDDMPTGKNHPMRSAGPNTST